MTAYFNAAADQVGSYAAMFTDEEMFLRAVGWLEAAMIVDVTAITGDREFPDDLREAMLGDIAVWRVDAGALPETMGRRHARLHRNSELVARLHGRFHDLARRQVVTRFGLLTDDPLDSLMKRQQWDDKCAR
jgi:hypothetical protein